MHNTQVTMVTAGNHLPLYRSQGIAVSVLMQSVIHLTTHCTSVPKGFSPRAVLKELVKVK